ncbi:MAG: beta-galactosidase [Clostridiales bacterium]|mgnify:CR=1 FL=1|nr:beta-galactosidase [Clostridiales bacterium]
MNKIKQARPEHPNPQFYRENWLNLNGVWEFETDFSMSGRDRKLYKAEKLKDKILVPFCPESKLSGIENKDFLNSVWYRREIDLTKDNLAGKVFLHFGAVDYESFLYINGAFVGSHKGGYSPFSFDIDPFAKVGKNTITLCALDDIRNPLVPRGKQSEKYNSHACDYTRTTGIWQTVWLEFLSLDYIESVKYYPDPANSSLTVSAQLVGKGEFVAKAFYEGRLVGQARAQSSGGLLNINLALAEKHLWELGQGRLYDLELTYGQDKVKSYFGLRDLRLEEGKFLINDKAIFQRLVLDQGFYPDGIYTAASDEDLKKDIEISMAAGFNGARLHEKVFEPRFLYHCDKMGYIVWGEYPNWGLDYSNPAAIHAVLPEWCEVMERDFNHPSIVGWCPFNETWDYDGRRQNDDLIKLVYETTKLLDPTRPCIDTSGNYHVKTDIYDVHDYEQDPKIFKEHYDLLAEEGVLFDKVNHNEGRIRQVYKGQPVFVSEYGGILWSPGRTDGWGYGQGPKTEEEFFERYRGLTLALLNNKKILGFCYTQLYDIEQEQNGLYTYEREAKFDMDIIKEINTAKAAIEE